MVESKKYQMKFELKDKRGVLSCGHLGKVRPPGEPVKCCSLLTTEPNELVGEVHGRMPMILPREYYDLYLNTPPEEAESLIEIMKPYPAEALKGEFDSEST
jgi:putative SOS response-associated peptidase YedK